MNLDQSIPELEILIQNFDQTFEKCLNILQSALGIEKIRELESIELKINSQKDVAEIDSNETHEPTKNDLDAMRVMVLHRRAEAKALFTKNQARFAETQAKFNRYRLDYKSR